jgi:hypothetical protein
MKSQAMVNGKAVSLIAGAIYCFKKIHMKQIFTMIWDYRIIDMEGNIRGDTAFYRLGDSFSEGLLPAETKDGITGYINKDGEFAFTVPFIAANQDYQWSALMAHDFYEGHALIQTRLEPPVCC